MSIGKIFISIDKTADYIPIVSTLTNLVDLFQKCVVDLCTNSETTRKSPYYTHIRDKQALRCVILLIPVIGNILIGIYDVVHQCKPSNREKSQNPESEQRKHIESSEDDTSEREKPSLDLKLVKALKTAVKSNKESHHTYTSILVHFHEIFSYKNSKIFLGNDRTRELFSEEKTINNYVQKEKYSLCEDYSDKNLTAQIKKELASITKVDLMISLNGLLGNKNTVQPHPTLNIPNLIHINYPISENDEVYEDALCKEKLEPIFEAIDAALNESKTVFLHCNQGEHRSATILVLYIQSRTCCSFKEAHAFVNSKRAIKPWDDDHATLMTTACSLYP